MPYYVFKEHFLGEIRTPRVGISNAMPRNIITGTPDRPRPGDRFYALLLESPTFDNAADFYNTYKASECAAQALLDDTLTYD